MSTGEDWYKIMFDTTREKDDQCSDATNSCGNKLNVLFFVIFTIIVQYVMLNLFILVIMQSFEENYINQNNPIQAFSETAEKFKEKWIDLCNE